MPELEIIVEPVLERVAQLDQARLPTGRVTEETHNRRSTHMSLLKQAERLFTALNTMDLDTAVAMISPSVDIRTPMGACTGEKAYREWI